MVFQLLISIRGAAYYPPSCQKPQLSKYFLDNGNRKLSKEEKETIKAAIDQADNLNELLQVAFTSLAVDEHR